ncbi:hypothetical protein [Natronohydrobacter thiooxidans]|uniref:hypothetical protein n=1 Tax=Natronohydrobacter thiooxidans TaxID=87172 RepID=UPI0008FF12FD|nr:hypothetical protein [Natronohydrobacter thiooxidans]
MTDRNHKIQMIMTRRISLVQAIADANCEHLRLNQIASGLLVLDQKHDEDGTELGAGAAERVANAEALAACMTRIEALETELADVDHDLAALTERDDT